MTAVRGDTVRMDAMAVVRACIVQDHDAATAAILSHEDPAELARALASFAAWATVHWFEDTALAAAELDLMLENLRAMSC